MFELTPLRHLMAIGLVVGLATSWTAEVSAQTAPPDSSFQKVVLAANINQPMELAVAPDGRVFFLDRTGKVQVYRPASQTSITAATLAVDVTGNHGLLGMALDPGFASNGFLYLYYSPPTPSVTRLSRFTVVGDALDMASEKVLLSVATTRICCHEGGSLAFGADGNLYLSTGDNTDPFASSGYAPIDERAGRQDFDAQRGTANSKDLRGKVLRIKPQADGTYTIPPGNLFANVADGRPEIYVMGIRNPFRITVDSANGWLYWGEVGPDATNDSTAQGPKGYDEFNQAKTAGFYGWPYCIANNKAYKDFNFATSTGGAAFNCAAVTNNSPNNTGKQALPAAKPAWIWYPYGASTEFPGVGTQADRCSIQGPVYHFNSALDSTKKLPSYYDNRVFIADWTRGWVQSVKTDASGNYVSMERFLSSFTFSSVMDIEVGPDGALYVLEWGAGQGHESGPDAKLSRIEFKGTGNASPTAVGKATPDNGAVPLSVTFSSAGSADPEGGTLTFAWDFTNDGTIDSTAATTSFVYPDAGNFVARLTVTDPAGKTGSASVSVTVGNTRPVVTLTSPPNGGIFQWGEQVPFTASVSDAEDGSTPTGVSCSAVAVMSGLGHDAHSHTDIDAHGCQGAIETAPLPADHANGNVSWVVEGVYADRGGAGGAASLTGKMQAILQPKRKQAEVYTSMSGVALQTTTDAGGGQNVTNVSNNDWIAFTPMNLKNITQVSYRAAAVTGAGGKIEIHVDSPTGTLISTATVAVTGGAQTFQDFVANVTDPGGVHTLYFVFKGGTGSSLINLNWFDWKGAGISVRGPSNTVAGSLYEGEDATTFSGVTVANNNAGYTGTGFADYDTAAGSFAEWTVNVPLAGVYALEFRYANGSTANRPMSIRVGTTVVNANQAFNPTGAWTTWSTVRLNATLAAGINKIRATALTANVGGPNIDSLAVPVFQAERSTLSSAQVESVQTGYTGIGYVTYQNASGASTEWTVSVPTAGTYTLELVYSNGDTTSRNLEIKVGTTVVSAALPFTPTGGFSTWSSKTVTVPLVAGSNKIRATTTGTGGPLMDALIRR